MISNTISRKEVQDIADQVMREQRGRDNSSSIERRENKPRKTEINVEKASSDGDRAQDEMDLPNEFELEELD